MNNRIIRVSDGRVYHCADCPYRDRERGFCGICMRKIIDDMKALKTERTEAYANGIQSDSP
jgi:hypothetical protein